MCGSSSYNGGGGDRNNSKGRKNSGSSANNNTAPTTAPTTGWTHMNKGTRWVGIHVAALETTVGVERTTVAVQCKQQHG